MYRSRSPETGRDPWSDGKPSGDPSGRRASAGRARRGGAGPKAAPGTDGDSRPSVRPRTSLAVAGFVALIGIGLIFGAQSSGPGNRLLFAVAVLGAQMLYTVVWALALRPPALWVVVAVGLAASAAANTAAVLAQVAALAPLGYVAAGGFIASVLGQLVRRGDRQRVTDSLGATMVIVVGTVAFATLIVLSRLPNGGTPAIYVALGATTVALLTAHLLDTVLPRPSLAPQVPRGAFGVVLGAMSGTLVGAVAGGYLAGLTPASGAVIGLAAAATGVLADLAADFGEAGRQMAGEPPTPAPARYVQGPLGGFALAAPLAYAMSALLL
ncbi:MAG TPA: hypothetical protein VF174_01015 [Micromonosporaceae bacterium]